MVANSLFKAVQESYIYYKDQQWYIGNSLGGDHRVRSEKHADDHHDDPTAVDKWQFRISNISIYVNDATLKFEYEATRIGMFVFYLGSEWV